MILSACRPLHLSLWLMMARTVARQNDADTLVERAEFDFDRLSLRKPEP